MKFSQCALLLLAASAVSAAPALRRQDNSTDPTSTDIAPPPIDVGAIDVGPAPTGTVDAVPLAAATAGANATDTSSTPSTDSAALTNSTDSASSADSTDAASSTDSSDAASSTDSTDAASSTDSTDAASSTDSAPSTIATAAASIPLAGIQPGAAAGTTCGAPSAQMLGHGPGLMAGGPGAIFFQSNDPEANTLYSINVDSAGNMSFGGAYMTGGFGGHIGPDITAPDALAIQGSVKVSGDKVVVANAGSNTFSLFQIDFMNPALVRMIGSPVSSFGEFPTTSTISAVTGNVCGMNSGATSTIQCYSVDLRRGLIPIPNSLRDLGLNLTTPPASQDGTPSHIVFSPDSTQLLASIKGSAAAPGFVLQFAVNPDGSLSEAPVKIPLASGVTSAGTLTFVHNAHAVIQQAIGVGFEVINLNDTATAGVAGALTPVNGTKRNQWSEDSAVTGNYYFSDLGNPVLTEIAVDSTTLAASVVNTYPLIAPGMDQEITTLDGHDTMFVLQPTTMTIQSFSLVGPGQAADLQILDIGAATAMAGVPALGKNVQGLNGFFQG